MRGILNKLEKTLERAKGQLEQRAAMEAEREREAREALIHAKKSKAEYEKRAAFFDDPNGYAKKILRLNLWDKQQEILAALPVKQNVFVQASHDVGKTFVCGAAVNWHHDCRIPSITKTTAPSKRQVIGNTWKEVRLQRKGRGMPPTSPKITGYNADGSINPEHVAEGYTAKDSNAFQGDHAEHMLIVFEENVGIHAQFWQAARGMLSSGPGNLFLAVCNPTNTASYAYQEFLTGNWHNITINAFDHPNVRAELLGKPRPYPKALSLQYIEGRLQQWARKLEKGEKRDPVRDICFPPLWFCESRGIDPTWYRPNDEFEGRVLGRWPTSNPNAVWSDAMFQLSVMPKPEKYAEWRKSFVQIGCDVARGGGDYTAFHVRQGGLAVYHFRVNGWDTKETAGFLKSLCKQFCSLGGQYYWQVPCLIDDTGVGGGVVDQRGEYCFVGVNAASKALDREKYSKRRHELWFTTAERAEEGEIDLSMLDKETLDLLKRQLMAPLKKMDGEGRREVEKKILTKKRLDGLSPDDADAFNLAHAGFNREFMALIGGDRDLLLQQMKLGKK